MKLKLNTFSKMFILLVVMLLFILLFYYYSTSKSMKIVKKTLQTERLNQISYVVNEMDASINQLSLFATAFTEESSVKDFKYMQDPTIRYSPYSLTEIKLAILEKIKLQNIKNGWPFSLSIYSPLSKDIVSYSRQSREEEFTPASISPQWTYSRSHGDELEFARYITSATTLGSPEYDLVIKVGFNLGNLRDMLDKYKASNSGKGDPFFYRRQSPPITNTTRNLPMIRRLMSILDEHPPAARENRVVAIDGRQYLVNIMASDQLGWHMIDYTPQDEILKPISQYNADFYFSLLFLLLIGTAACTIIYRNIQIPLSALIRALQRFKNGNFAVRVPAYGNSEFSFLIDRFNGMAIEIEDLIEKVYRGKVQTQEAMLKQLQSQINPHFLYNSLAYIIGVAKIKDTESVIRMAHHLCDYFRFTTTKVDRTSVTLKEELQFVMNYMEVQQMRMERIRYELSVPDEMHEVRVPPLIIQPVIENAIIHGLEPLSREGIITITGTVAGDFYRITIDDNGVGLPDDRIYEIGRQITFFDGDGLGTGLRNIHQRLNYRYGEGSGVQLIPSPLGGLRVVLTWNRNPYGEESS